MAMHGEDISLPLHFHTQPLQNAETHQGPERLDNVNPVELP